MVPWVMPDGSKSADRQTTQLPRGLRRPRSQHPKGYCSGSESVSGLGTAVETLRLRLAGNRSRLLATACYGLSPQWHHSVLSTARRPASTPSTSRLLCCLFRLGLYYAAGDERPIGSGRVRAKLLESPTSRPCRVIKVKVVCGAQDAEPAGGDPLQEAKLSGSGGKNVKGVWTDGVCSQRGMNVSLRS